MGARSFTKNASKPLHAIIPGQQTPQLLTTQLIACRVEALASVIAQDVPANCPSVVLLGVAMGAVDFWVALRRSLERKIAPLYSGLIFYRRYQGDTIGLSPDDIDQPQIFGIDKPIEKGSAIFIIEDLLDEGLTMQRLMSWIKVQYPEQQYHSVVMLDKNKSDFKSDYVGFYLDSKSDPWVVGYGIDYKGLYRGLDTVMEVDKQGANNE